MAFNYAYDGAPSKCAAGPRPGTKALRDGVMERFGCGDDGIFNCRTVRVHGSSTLSFHADGRAWDAHCTTELNRRIAAWLIQWANVLGVQEVISYGRRWDSRTRQWTVYHGDDMHTGHVHVAQCVRAANSLTLATVRAIEDGAPGPINQEDDVTKDDIAALAAAISAPIVKAIDDMTVTLSRHIDAGAAAEVAAEQADKG